jgi:hypothetical protein
MLLTRACTLGRVTALPPDDHPGTRRFQKVIDIEPGRRYQGATYYIFPGGCVTYRVDLRSGQQARPLDDVNQTLGFVSRDQLGSELRQRSDGRLQLDPN